MHPAFPESFGLYPALAFQQVQVLRGGPGVCRRAEKVQVAGRAVVGRPRDFQFRVHPPQLVAECRHAQHAAYHDGRLCVDTRVAPEDLRVGFEHQFRDPVMLFGTQRREVARPALAVRTGPFHAA